MGSMLKAVSGKCDWQNVERQRTVGYDYRVIALNSLICDSFGQVDGEEDRVHLATERIERRLEQHYWWKVRLLRTV